MTNRREPSTPPAIAGFEPLRLLGMGGFADVFVYRQLMPQREVAVKVLTATRIDDEVRARFRNEANLMAQLSQHPAIVTIHQADIASDRRPYLVMELCSGPGLGARYRQQNIPLPEVLRLGVRLASAVETAHRMGILHYDIKPANVLTTDFGWPALTDFGIASTVGRVGSAELGLSIPWSPPELLSSTPTVGDPRSDVYSLIATIYSAVAGRSPFEVPGGANGAMDLMHRIENLQALPTGRPDVPPNLELLFEKGLAKNPAERFQTSLEVAQALQRIETELGLPQTHIEIAAGPESAHAAVSQAEQETRVRPIHVVDAGVAPSPEADSHPEERRRGPLFAVLATLSVLVILGAVFWAALGNWGPKQDEFDSPISSGELNSKTAVPSPSNVVVSSDPDNPDAVIFRWENPNPQPGDTYLWAVVDPGAAVQQNQTEEPVAVVPLPDEGPVCIEMLIVREDRRASDAPARECGP